MTETPTIDQKVGPNPEFPHKLTGADIVPHPIGVGETEIVVQRHAKYIKDRTDPRVGSLEDEARQKQADEARQYFAAFLDQLPEDERDTVDLLVVASDTAYYGGGQRSYETAQIAQDAAAEVFEKAKIAAGNILNLPLDPPEDTEDGPKPSSDDKPRRPLLKGNGGPRLMHQLGEPRFIDESPEYRKLLEDEYGDMAGDMAKDFWTAFERDTHWEAREEMGAEGPDEIADRMKHSANMLARFAKLHHAIHPGRRLVMWVATHTDVINPFVKRDIFGVGKEHDLEVDYGGGIVIDIDTAGAATTQIAGVDYEVPLKR